MRFNRDTFRNDPANRWRKPFAPTSRQRAAAIRAVNRQRQRLGLFRDIIPVETPEERLRRYYDLGREWYRQDRQFRATMWREARRILYSLPVDKRREIVSAWNASPLPAEPEYLLDYLRNKWGLT